MRETFVLQRPGRNGVNVNYEIEVSDNKGRYLIDVKNADKPKDKDKIPLQPIGEDVHTVVEYVKKNLRIYTKPDGSIDYLSLNNDPSMFTAQNRQGA